MKILRSPRFWIGIGISVLSLWLAFRSINFTDLENAIGRAQFLWLLPAVLIQFFAVWARAQRWATLLDRKGLVWKAFWSHSIGFLFTNVFPFRLGEPARAIVMSERSNIPLFQVAGSILIERILDVAIVVLALAGVLPFLRVPELVSRSGLVFGSIVLVALIVLWLIVRFRTLSDRIVRAVLERLKFLPGEALLARWSELVEGLTPLLSLRVLLGAIFWTVAAWFFSLAIYYCSMKAFQPDATVIESIFVVVTLALAITLPSSPGFIGVFQLAGQQALVLPFAGKYTPSNALAIILTAWLIYYVITTLFGVIALWQMGESFGKLGRLITSRSTPAKKDLAEE